MRQRLLAGRMVWPVLSLLVLLLVPLSCRDRPAPSSPLILNDFETEADLERIAWRCRTVFALTDTPRSHGQSGLMMTLYPGDYPGLRLLLAPGERRWAGYRYLALDVANPGSEMQTLHYRIDDRQNPDYGDRVNGSVLLPPGETRLRLDLIQARTSASGRPLDLDLVQQVILFQTSPDRPRRLALDFIRLETN